MWQLPQAGPSCCLPAASARSRAGSGGGSGMLGRETGPPDSDSVPPRAAGLGVDVRWAAGKEVGCSVALL